IMGYTAPEVTWRLPNMVDQTSLVPFDGEMTTLNTTAPRGTSITIEAEVCEPGAMHCLTDTLTVTVGDAVYVDARNGSAEFDGRTPTTAVDTVQQGVDIATELSMSGPEARVVINIAESSEGYTVGSLTIGGGITLNGGWTAGFEPTTGKALLLGDVYLDAGERPIELRRVRIEPHDDASSSSRLKISNSTDVSLVQIDIAMGDRDGQAILVEQSTVRLAGRDNNLFGPTTGAAFVGIASVDSILSTESSTARVNIRFEDPAAIGDTQGEWVGIAASSSDLDLEV